MSAHPIDDKEEKIFMNTDNEIQNLVEKLNKVEGFLSGMTMVALIKDQSETIRHINDMRMEVVHLKDGMLKIYWELKDLREGKK